MLTLQMVACIGMVVGAFLLLGTWLNDFTGNIFLKAFEQTPGNQRRDTGRDKAEEKVLFTQRNRRSTEDPAYHRQGRFFPDAMYNLPASVCSRSVYGGNAGKCVPDSRYWLVGFCSSLLVCETDCLAFQKGVSAELETALSIITTAYLRSEDILTSIEENLAYLNPPGEKCVCRFCGKGTPDRPGSGGGTGHVKRNNGKRGVS